VVIAAVVLSIVIAPTLIKYNKPIGRWFFPHMQQEEAIPQDQDEQPYQLVEHTSELKDHVILCGFGRVGQILARFLEQEHIPSVALDLDPIRISTSSLAGEHAFLGDVRHPDILASAGLSRARMVVITFADETAALETLQHIRALRLDVPVFVRTRNDSNLKTFQEAGATEVVPESLEASLMLASHLLLTLGVPASKILAQIRAIHADRYQIIQGFFQGSDDSSLLEDEESLRKSLHVITITENAYAVGKSIQDVMSPNNIPSAIKILTRATQRFPNPDPMMIIEVGDVLVLYATPETVYLLTEHILRGP
jgi:CPA2 family monovalent cation:H+ antiporter-2